MLGVVPISSNRLAAIDKAIDIHGGNTATTSCHHCLFERRVANIANTPYSIYIGGHDVIDLDPSIGITLDLSTQEIGNGFRAAVVNKDPLYRQGLRIAVPFLFELN